MFIEIYLIKCERKPLSSDPCHCQTPRTVSQNRPYLVKDLSNMKRLTATSILVTIFKRGSIDVFNFHLKEKLVSKMLSF